MTERSLIFLDQTGDTTIVWDEDTDDKMIAIIQRKMDEGFVFYIVKPTLIPMIRRTVKAKSIKQIRDAGSVLIRDEALEKLFLAGSISTASAAADDAIEPLRKAESANDVATNHAVAVRPAKGG